MTSGVHLTESVGILALIHSLAATGHVTWITWPVVASECISARIHISAL